jgi:hypothetical protein
MEAEKDVTEVRILQIPAKWQDRGRIVHFFNSIFPLHIQLSAGSSTTQESISEASSERETSSPV